MEKMYAWKSHVPKLNRVTIDLSEVKKFVAKCIEAFLDLGEVALLSFPGYDDVQIHIMYRYSGLP